MQTSYMDREFQEKAKIFNYINLHFINETKEIERIRESNVSIVTPN